jgi:hypothetical protein
MDASDDDDPEPPNSMSEDSDSDGREERERLQSRQTARILHLERLHASRLREEDLSDNGSSATELLQQVDEQGQAGDQFRSLRARRRATERRPRHRSSSSTPRRAALLQHEDRREEDTPPASPSRHLNAFTNVENEQKYEGSNEQATHRDGRQRSASRHVARSESASRGSPHSRSNADDRVEYIPQERSHAGTPYFSGPEEDSGDSRGGAYRHRSPMDTPGSSVQSTRQEQTLEIVARIATQLAEAQLSKNSHDSESSTQEIIEYFRHHHPRAIIGVNLTFFTSLSLIFEVFHLADKNEAKTLKALKTLANKSYQSANDNAPTTVMAFVRDFTEKQLQTTYQVAEKMKDALRDPRSQPAPMETIGNSHVYIARARDFVHNVDYALTACECTHAEKNSVVETFMILWINGTRLPDSSKINFIAKYTAAQRKGGEAHSVYIDKIGQHLEARNATLLDTPKEEKGRKRTDDHPKNDKAQYRHPAREHTRRHQQDRVPRARDDAEPRRLVAAPAAVSHPAPSNAQEVSDSIVTCLNMIATQGGPPRQDPRGPYQEKKYPPRDCEAPGHRGHDVADCPDRATLCNQHGNAHAHALCMECHNCGERGHYAKTCTNKCRDCHSRPHERGCKNSFGANSTPSKRPREDEDRAHDRSPHRREDRPRHDERPKRARSAGNGTGRRR